MFPYRDALEHFSDGALTVWAPFETGGDHFAPSTENHIINFIVDDLTAILAGAAEEGVQPVKPREDHPYCSFGWVMDPDGRKIELWQPAIPPSQED